MRPAGDFFFIQLSNTRNIFRLYKKGYKQNEIAEALKISLERVKEFLEE